MIRPEQGVLLSRAVLLCVLSATSAAADADRARPVRAADEAERLVLARVNGEPITLAYLREAFGNRHAGHGGLLVGEEILRRVLDKAVDEKLLIQEGRRMGIPEEPAFKESLEAYRDLLLLGALEERRVEAPSQASAAEIEAAYAHLSRQIRVFLIETRESTAADTARLRVKAGESFDAVARQASVHASRTRGGDLGWVTWGVLDEATEKVVLATPIGELSEVFAVERGFRFLRAAEERRGEPPPRERVRERTGAIIKARKRAEIRASLLAAIRREHPPTEDAAAVRALLAAAPDPKAASAPPDGGLLLKTATGLPVTAGYVRGKAARAGLSLDTAWRSAAEDALLIDEARRRIPLDALLTRQLELYAEARIREEIEGDVILRGLTLDDAEARSYYQKDPAAFGTPASRHLRHIVLGTAEEAAEVRGRLLAGADFEALARARSVDKASSSSGGDLGWIEAPRAGAGGTPWEAISALTAGEVSGVIRTPLGYAVVQALEIRPASAEPFEKVRHEAARRLMIEKQAERRAAFVAKLREAARVSRDPEALRRAASLQETLASTRPAAPAALETAR